MELPIKLNLLMMETMASPLPLLVQAIHVQVLPDKGKALSTRVSAGPSSYDGYVSALFDNVYINDEETIYDDFSTGSFDPTKWQQWGLEIAREISNGKLSIRPNDQATTYLEAKALIGSASEISPGALGHARIGGYYYNESRGPGSEHSYNGYEGNVWVSSRIELDDNNNLTGYCSLWRHDDANSWGTGTGLFHQNFTTPFAFDTEYTLSIELRDRTFIFKCNNETYQYTVTTPMYEPYNGQYRALNSRVMADPGESGYMKTTFDNVCLEPVALGADGDVAPLGNRDGQVNVGDALVALRFALLLETPTQEDMQHGDVAPLDVNGKPDPDGQITVGDALVILRKALGLVNWFYMTDYFPLDGSWETDDWTMFSAQKEQDINGINTRALVDTAGQEISFWSNDEKGLLVLAHAEMDDGFPISAFSTPIVVADAVSKVGEKKENIISDEGDTIKIISELVAVESVSVPAGNFTDCLKFEFAVYDVTGEQEVFLFKENLWLAKDVGFVKGHNYASPGQGYLHTQEGTTRQLLSYHVTTLSDLTADQQAIKDIYKESEKCFANEDIDTWAASASDNYYDECRDKATRRAEIEAIFANNSEIMLFRSPGEIVVTGGKASAMDEYLISAMNDATGQRWLRWGRELSHFTKENGEWKGYGDQLQFKFSWSGVWVRTETGGVSLKIDLETSNCEGDLENLNEQIASLTIAGPPGTSIDSDFKQDFHPEWGTGLYWRTEDISNATNGFYTFTLTDVNGNMWVNTDYLHLDLEQPLDIPTLVSPIDDATVIPGDVTFGWNSVNGANYYRVDMENMPNVYPANATDTQAVVNLPEGSYSWRARARVFDMYGDFDYESRSGWEDFSVVSSE